MTEIKQVLRRIVIIAGWSLIGWIAGSVIGWFIFDETGENIGRIIGMLSGFLWGLKSNTSWLFV